MTKKISSVFELRNNRFPTIPGQRLCDAAQKRNHSALLPSLVWKFDWLDALAVKYRLHGNIVSWIESATGRKYLSQWNRQTTGTSTRKGEET